MGQGGSATGNKYLDTHDDNIYDGTTVPIQDVLHFFGKHTEERLINCFKVKGAERIEIKGRINWTECCEDGCRFGNQEQNWRLITFGVLSGYDDGNTKELNRQNFIFVCQRCVEVY